MCNTTKLPWGIWSFFGKLCGQITLSKNKNAKIKKIKILSILEARL